MIRGDAETRDMEKSGLQLSKDEEEVIRLRDEGESLPSISKQVYDETRARQAVLQIYRRAKEKRRRLEANERYKGKEGLCPIDELPLSARARNALTRAGFKTVGEVVGKSDKELLELPGLGPDSLDLLRRMMEKWGLGSSKIKKDQNQQAAPAAPAGEGSQKPKKRKKYPCKLCLGKFGSPRALALHNKYVHSSGPDDTGGIKKGDIVRAMRAGNRLKDVKVDWVKQIQIGGRVVGPDGKVTKEKVVVLCKRIVSIMTGKAA